MPNGNPQSRTAPPTTAAMMEPEYDLSSALEVEVEVAEALLVVDVMDAGSWVATRTVPLTPRERGRWTGVDWPLNVKATVIF